MNVLNITDGYISENSTLQTIDEDNNHNNIFLKLYFYQSGWCINTVIGLKIGKPLKLFFS